MSLQRRVHRIGEYDTGTITHAAQTFGYVWVQWDRDEDGTAGSLTVEWLADLVEVAR